MEEIQQAISGIELDPDSPTMSQEEMVKVVLMLGTYAILFPALQSKDHEFEPEAPYLVRQRQNI